MLLVSAVLCCPCPSETGAASRVAFPGWSYLPMVRQAAQSLAFAFASAFIRSISTAIYMVHAGI